MKKKIYRTLFLLLLSTSLGVYAKDTESSHPNLGRDSTPIKAVSITPAPLPSVEIELSDEPVSVPEVKEKEKEPESESKPPEEKTKKIVHPKVAPHLEPEAVVKKRVITPIPLAVLNQTPTRISGNIATASLAGKTHDVYDFDIAGFALGQTPQEVSKTARLKGFQITKLQNKLPRHFTLYYTHLCKRQGIFRPAELKDCVYQMGALNEATYVSDMWLERPFSGETVQVLFTSPATDNTAYKVYYKNAGDNSLGTTRTDLAEKFRRKRIFWDKMFDTYGLPDDSDNYIWGNPQQAYMQAMMQGANYDAYIVLEDAEAPYADEEAAGEYAQGFEYTDSFFFNE